MAKGLPIRAMTEFVAPYPTLGEISRRAAYEYYRPGLTNPWARPHHLAPAATRLTGRRTGTELRIGERPERRAGRRQWPCRPRAALAFRASSFCSPWSFVMVSEILIYVPSIANFRHNWLSERLDAARLAALVLDAAPDRMVPRELELRLLDQVGAYAVAEKEGDTRRLLAISDMPPPVEASFDLRTMNVLRRDHALLRGAADAARPHDPRRRQRRGRQPLHRDRDGRDAAAAGDDPLFRSTSCRCRSSSRSSRRRSSI